LHESAKARLAAYLKAQGKEDKLDEAMIVLSLIAILAAILVPSIIKNINDSRITKAKSDINSIGKMMIQCRDDMGYWPVMNRDGNSVRLLIGTTPDPDTSLIPSSNRGISSWNRNPNESIWWELVNVNNSYIKRDPNPHNLPSWRGPYLNKLNLDPWGMPYLINAEYLQGAASPDNTKKVWVISAGTNKLMDTNFEGNSLQTGDDDIGYSIQ